MTTRSRHTTETAQSTSSSSPASRPPWTRAGRSGSDREPSPGPHEDHQRGKRHRVITIPATAIMRAPDPIRCRRGLTRSLHTLTDGRLCAGDWRSPSRRARQRDGITHAEQGWEDANDGGRYGRLDCTAWRSVRLRPARVHGVGEADHVVDSHFLNWVARLYPTFDCLEGALYRRGPRLTRRFR